MITKREARKLVNELFEEEVLVIGGIVAIHEVDDELIWRLVKSLSVIRERTLQRLEDRPSADGAEQPGDLPDLEPHPAIEEFLRSIRRS